MKKVINMIKVIFKIILFGGFVSAKDLAESVEV